MRDVDPVVLARDFGEFDNLIRFGKARRDVLKGCGKTERALFHRHRDQRFHLLHLIRRRLTVVITDDVLANLRGADKGAEINAGTLPLKSLEVFVESAPVHFQIEVAIEIFLFLENAIVDRRDRFTLAGDFSGDALHHFAHRARIDQQKLFGLAQHVDKARRDDLPARIDHAFGPGVSQTSVARYTRNSIAIDGDIRAKGRPAAAIDNSAVTNNDVVRKLVRAVPLRLYGQADTDCKQADRSDN